MTLPIHPPPRPSLWLELTLLRRHIGCITRIAVGGDHTWLHHDGGRMCINCHRRIVYGRGRTAE